MSVLSLLVVDCQYDFIDGSLACEGAREAVDSAVVFINARPDVALLYSVDWHSPENRSFLPNGGIWPPHCIAGERGSRIHEKFHLEVLRAGQRPDSRTIYRKGTDDLVEEYSAFGARNDAGRTVGQDIGDDVAICGIASEYCVRESVLDLLKAGRHVTVLADALGWVDRRKHEENLEDLEKRGAVLRWIGTDRG
ncbi:MAG: isochorismatase family protein [Fretibacterium sp.]